MICKLNLVGIVELKEVRENALYVTEMKLKMFFILYQFSQVYTYQKSTLKAILPPKAKYVQISPTIQ